MIEVLIAVVAGYVIGLLQNGININHVEPEVETDKEGKPVYNDSVSSLDQEQRTWIEKNREV